MPILCYHKINDTISDDWNNITVGSGAFREQLEYIKKNYQVVSSVDGNTSDVSMVITFDDGYADFYEIAWPIIREMNIPVTLFITTLHIDSDTEDWCNYLSNIIMQGFCNRDYFDFENNRYKVDSTKNRLSTNKSIFRLLKQRNLHERKEAINCLLKMSDRELVTTRNNYRYLSSSQILELSKSDLITFGGHTVTHPSLGCLSYDEQVIEIVESKHVIENIIGKEIVVFSYPFGGIEDYDETTIDILKRAGFKKAYTTTRKKKYMEWEEYEISRKCISEKNLNDFVTKCRGLISDK